MSFGIIKAALQKGRLAHAFLFLGPSGSGQMEAARGLGCLLFGVKNEKIDNHPDFRVFEPQEDKRAMSIEEVRQMLTMANLRPFQAPSKLFVIDRADTLSDISQNALLKTLEGPPGHMYFILIANAAEKILPTVRSRTQEMRFSGGSDAEADPKRESAEQSILDFIAGKRVPELGLTKREEILPVLEGVIRELRGALLANVGAGKSSGRPGLAEMAERLSADTLIEKIEKLAEFKEKLEHNVNVKLALSVLWDEL